MALIGGNATREGFYVFMVESMALSAAEPKMASPLWPSELSADYLQRPNTGLA